MSDFALDGNHDLDVSGQEMHIIDNTPGNPAATAQEVSIALQFFKGEWPLNLLVGIPYFQQVFVKNPSLSALSVLYSRASLSIPGIEEVREMGLEFDNGGRRLTVRPSLRSTDGSIITDELAVSSL